jgi:hypothetical protein
LKALDQIVTVFADFAGDVIMYRPDLARMVRVRPDLGAGGNAAVFRPAFTDLATVFFPDLPISLCPTCVYLPT